MAHPDMQLVSRIIRKGSLEEVLDWGITIEDLTLIEAKSMLHHISGMHLSPDTRGSVIGPNAATVYYPNFVYCDDEGMTTHALCQQVRDTRIDREMEAALLEADKIRRVNPREALKYMDAVSARLNQLSTQSHDMDFLAGMTLLEQRYLLQEQGLLVGAAHWPETWTPLEDVTRGIQYDDYIVIYGRPKSMKSFVLADMAASMYMQGLRVLLYTKEMPAEQLYRRVVGFYLRLPYNELRLSMLNPVQRESFLSFRYELEEERARTGGQHDLIVISGQDAPGGDNIRWVASKVKKYKPHVVFIDGLYLLAANYKTKSDEERVRSISRDARQMVLDSKVPLIATMQATRAAAKHKSANLDEIAYSDAISQDATIAMRSINDDEGLSLVLGGSREFKLKGLRLNSVPCTDFRCVGALSEGDTLRAKELDDQRAMIDSGQAAQEHRPIRSTTTKQPVVSKEDLVARAAAIEGRLNARMGDSGDTSGGHP